MGKRRSVKWIFSLLMLVLIFVRPRQAVDGAQRAMRMWYTGVAPAMLPFLALLPLITGPDACAAYKRMFSGVMGKLFRLPGEAAPAVIAAMVSGSPGGIVAVSEIKSSGGISDSDAARIALACSGVSPAWLVLGVGSGMLGSRTAGLKLAAVQAAVQLFLLKLLEKVKIETRDENKAMQGALTANPMRSAAETVICVCGYMCVFGAYGSVIASFAGKWAGIGLLTALDLPSGLGMIAENRFPGDMAAIGVAMGFGGICIGAQNMEKLKKLGVCRRDYAAVRLTAASICGILCAVTFRNQHAGALKTPADGKIYVISLLAAAVCAVPGMIFLSKNIFLNKGKSAENAADFQ